MKMLQSFSSLSTMGMLERYRANRQRTTELFTIVRDAMYEQPLELRHPFIFYLGHIPAFHFNTLAKRGFGLDTFHAEFDELFRRGIDPDSADDARKAQALWPSVDAVKAYARQIDDTIESLLSTAEPELIEDPYSERTQAVFTVLEHEEMHQETLMYIIKRLDAAHKTCDGIDAFLGHPSNQSTERILIPAGRVTLGARPNTIPFGWDNEFGAMQVDVHQFALESLPVTNREFLAFVKQGASPPADWIQTSDGWMQRTMYGIVPLQMSWPAYVSLDAAQAYAHSRGARIMTEAEYHRAAFGTAEGIERLMPWGNEAPSGVHGNFGFRRFDPEPVGLSPRGASAWGVFELVGNGWEWTSSPFAPLTGFQPMPLYPEYSADFFDGKHAVLKGASPVTAMTLLRPSLRNWFRRDYTYAFTKFRLAYDV